MSGDTWKKEFYPVAAVDTEPMEVGEALDHSIQKWKGLLPENLKKHEVEVKLNDGYSPVLVNSDGHPILRIDFSSCALCEHFECNEEEWSGWVSGDDETICPLDTSGDCCEKAFSTYDRFCDGAATAQDMVDALEKAKEEE